MLEFKRGIINSVKYAYFEKSCVFSQDIFLVDTEGNEYSTLRFLDKHEGLFGEGDRVSFLWDNETKSIVRLRLNPFYKEKEYES